LAHAQAQTSPANLGLYEVVDYGNHTLSQMVDETIQNRHEYKVSRVCTSFASIRETIGHVGSAAGLAAVARAALSLYQEILPPPLRTEPLVPTTSTSGSVTPRKPQFWLRNRIEGPRQAGVSVVGLGGTHHHVVLEAAEVAGQPNARHTS